MAPFIPQPLLDYNWILVEVGTVFQNTIGIPQGLCCSGKTGWFRTNHDQDLGIPHRDLWGQGNVEYPVFLNDYLALDGNHNVFLV